MNCVTMIGRLTADPDLRRTGSGTACCSFTLAVKRPKVKDTTDFHSFVVWQQGAEYLCQYGHKGDLVGVTGYLTTREWTDKDSNKRKTIEVTCDAVELLSSKKSDNPAQKSNSLNAPTNDLVNRQYQQQGFGGYQQNYPVVDIPDEQLPF